MKHPWISLLMSILIGLAILVSACGSSTPTQRPVDDGRTGQAGEEDSGVELPPAINPGEEGEINIFFKFDSMDPEFYALFNESSGYEVTETNFDTQTELLATMRRFGSAESYALIAPSNYEATLLIQEGLLAPLDHNNIPNINNLNPTFQSPPYDPGNVYCVPYQWGTTGLGFNGNEMSAPQSWSVIFDATTSDPSYGRVTMQDDAREALAAALFYLGYSVNTTTQSELEQARDLLIRAKDGLAGFSSETFEDQIISGDNLMAEAGNGQFRIARETIENFHYIIPQEGGIVWVENLCIPASTSADKKAAAEAFINFLLSPEISASWSQYNNYATTNAAAEAMLPEEFMNDTWIYPPGDILSKLQLITPVGDFEALYDQLWEEVKSAP